MDAYGDDAATLAGFPTGSALKTTGTLEQVTWKTGDKVEHQRMAVRSLCTELVALPDKHPQPAKDEA